MTCVLEFSFIAKVASSRKLHWLELLLKHPKFLSSKFFSPETMNAMMSYVSAKFASTVTLGNSNDFFRSE